MLSVDKLHLSHWQIIGGHKQMQLSLKTIDPFKSDPRGWERYSAIYVDITMPI